MKKKALSPKGRRAFRRESVDHIQGNEPGSYRAQGRSAQADHVTDLEAYLGRSGPELWLAMTLWKNHPRIKWTDLLHRRGGHTDCTGDN